MTYLREQFSASPAYARVAPFLIFLGFALFQTVGATGAYWGYLAKTLAGGWLVWEMRPFVAEMKWAFSWEAVVVGIAVCVMWIGLNDWLGTSDLHPKSGKPPEVWNPQAQFGQNSGLAWFYVVIRLLGSSLIVPPLEEVFYRSFLYRWFVKEDFQAMPLRRFHGLSFVVTSIVFGAEHGRMWLSGLLCGLAYQWLVLRKDRIGDAITAHAITNFLLGIWVFWKGAWGFW